MAASYGDHEVTPYLHQRFCATDTTSNICRIVILDNDEFSHWIFFTGFVMVNTAILLLQNIFPYREKISNIDSTLHFLNALFVGAAVPANPGFEEIGLDLYIVAYLALISIHLLWRPGRQPMFIYYTVACRLGLVGTVVAQSIRTW